MAQLRPIVAALRGLGAEGRSGEPLEAKRVEALLRRHPRDGRGLFSRAQLIAGVRLLSRREGWRAEGESLAGRLRKRGVRTLSGVAPLTVLTRPYPCPGRCVFCPSDVRMPKSYLSAEPGAQRAAQHAFDPYRQTLARIRAYHEMGHVTDKVELIVLGGTWSFYPEPYRVWFVTRCLDALHDFAAGGEARAADPARTIALDFLDLQAAVRGDAPGESYNAIVAGHLRRRLGGRLLAADEHASWTRLEAALAHNATSACRVVGLSLETRPDCVTQDEVVRLRRLGATKVQIGIQSLDDAVLAANQRGHGADVTRRAIGRLRAAGFKIQAHWMPNLLGATPDADLADFTRLFADPEVRPDELKIYPTSLIETAELMRHWRAGAWRPYDREELVDLLDACLAATPEWCRLTRVIRDIASDDIVTGNREANLREVVEARQRASGRPPRDIRSREIRAGHVSPADLRLVELEYATGIGSERFLQMVAPGDRIVAFLRLSLPEAASFVEEIARSALIREVHVYGPVAALGATGRAQHRGLGRRLVERAVQIARQHGYADLAVISAPGTRAYYRRLGFADGALYQHRAP